jgi:hypothetical protein
LNSKIIRKDFGGISKKALVIFLIILLFGSYLRLTISKFSVNAENFNREAQAACLSSTEKQYSPICKEFLYGGQHPLGWPFILSLSYYIFPVNSITDSAFTLLLALLTLILIFFVTYAVFKDEVLALFSCFLYAIFPLHIQFSAQPSTEVVNELFLLLTLLVTFVCLKRSSWKLYSLMFLLLVYLMHIRVENSLLILLFLIYLLYRKGLFFWMREYKSLIVPALLAILCILPAIYTTLFVMAHNITTRVLLHNAVAYFKQMGIIFYPFCAIILVSLIGFVSESISKRVYHNFSTLLLLFFSYASVQFISIVGENVKPFAYMFSHGSVLLFVVIAAGVTSFYRMVLEMRKHFQTRNFELTVLFLLFAFFFVSTLFLKLGEAACCGGESYVDLKDLNRNNIPMFYMSFRSSILQDVVEASKHIKRSDYILYIDYSVSTESIFLNTPNSFVDYRLLNVAFEEICKGTDLVKSRMPEVKKVLSEGKVVYLFEIKDEYHACLYEPFGEHFRLEHRFDEGRISVYQVTLQS